MNIFSVLFIDDILKTTAQIIWKSLLLLKTNVLRNNRTRFYEIVTWIHIHEKSGKVKPRILSCCKHTSTLVTISEKIRGRCWTDQTETPGPLEAYNNLLKLISVTMYVNHSQTSIARQRGRVATSTHQYWSNSLLLLLPPPPHTHTNQ